MEKAKQMANKQANIGKQSENSIEQGERLLENRGVRFGVRIRTYLN